MRRRGHQQGVIFFATVILTLVLLNLALGYLVVARTELRIARNQLDALKSFYAAESGLEHALGELFSNVDTGDGILGDVPAIDLDGDAVADYTASYDSGTGIISATGGELVSQEVIRTIEAKVSPRKWTGAFMVGNRIPSVSNCSFSVVNGNVDAFSTINPNFTSQHTVTGTVTQNNASLTIPATDTSPVGPWPAYATVPNQHADCSWVTSGSPTITGVHYVNGPCTINFGGTVALTINGSLIVNGNLSIAQVKGLNITPAGQDPALVASGDLSISNVSSGSADIQGLIYAGGNIALNVWNFFPNPRHSINGAIVSGGDISLVTIARTDWVFDSSLDPPFFTGSAGYRIDYWKGHI